MVVTGLRKRRTIKDSTHSIKNADIGMKYLDNTDVRKCEKRCQCDGLEMKR